MAEAMPPRGGHSTLCTRRYVSDRVSRIIYAVPMGFARGCVILGENFELGLWSLEFARAFARARRIERRGAQMARVARATLLRLRSPRSCEEECPLKCTFPCKRLHESRFLATSGRLCDPTQPLITILQLRVCTGEEQRMSHSRNLGFNQEVK